MFSLQFHYAQVIFKLKNPNIFLAAQALSVDGMCREVNKTETILEAFQDNIDKEAKNAGSIFCDTMNGRMISFPESMNDLTAIVDYKTKVMAQANLNVMEVAVNAKSYSVNLPKPEIGFPEGYLDIYEIGTDRLIEADDQVLEYLSTVHNSYQSREELCYIMTSTLGEDTTPESSFTTQMCNRFGSWWTVCKFTRKISVALKGLCDSSPIDRAFSLIAPKKGSTDRYGTFVGTTGWVINFDKGESTWKIEHPAFMANTIKLLDSSRRPFGKKTWEVRNYICDQGETVPLVLLLSNCDQDQFTCNDGTCVALTGRCDKKQDCRDVSDEKQCKIVALDEKRYSKDDAPPSVVEGEKLNVTLSMDIQNILDIQEVASVLILKFDLEEAWVDSRLQLYNLKEDMEMNTLVNEEKSIIWVPTIIFSNTREDLTSKNDEKAFAKVIRNPEVNGTLISTDVNEDILVYQGSQNEIRINRVYEVEFICTYDMQYYPFDIQICTIDLVVDGNTAKFLELQPGKLVYTGGANFAQYYVMSYDIYSSTVKGRTGVKVSLKLGRRLLGVILTAYTPTILLNIIGYSGNYFKSFFFEAVVTVNLTCMLVLATMFISISNDLPKTAYLKMMDYWLIFNLLLPFIEVIVHTYMEKLTDEDEKEEASDPVLPFTMNDKDGDLSLPKVCSYGSH